MNRLLLIVMGVLAWATPALAQQGVVTDFESAIRVNENLTIDTREAIQINNSDGSFDGGIERDFWPRRQDQQGHHWKVTYKSLQALVDGQPSKAQVREVGDILQVRIPPNTPTLERGSHVFEVSYETNGEFVRYGGFDELIGNATGHWNWPIERVKVTLQLPGRVPKDKVQLTSWTTVTATELFCDCTEEVGTNIIISNDRTFDPGESLHVTLRVPADYFTSSVADEFRFWTWNHPTTAASLIFLAGLICYFVVSLGLFQALQCIHASGRLGPLNEDHLAMMIAGFVALLSLASIFLFNEPYTAMPGAIIGLLLSIIISGGAHGPNSRYLWLVIAGAANFAFFYFMLRMLARFTPLFRLRRRTEAT